MASCHLRREGHESVAGGKRRWRRSPVLARLRSRRAARSGSAQRPLSLRPHQDLQRAGKEQQGTIDIPYFGKTSIMDIAGRTIKPDGSILELKKNTIFERD